MRSVLVFIALCAVCKADTVPQIRCGEIPEKIVSCLGNPHLLTAAMTRSCKTDSQCERLTCIYNRQGWLNNNALDKKKISEYLDNYSKEHPEWAPAVAQTRAACLQTDLPAQGIPLNCPAYDVSHCLQTNFARFAQPSQWSASSDCEHPRQFAAACPFCPDDCFAPMIPIGACNACLSLPRSP